MAVDHIAVARERGERITQLNRNIKLWQEAYSTLWWAYRDLVARIEQLGKPKSFPTTAVVARNIREEVNGG